MPRNSVREIRRSDRSAIRLRSILDVLVFRGRGSSRGSRYLASTATYKRNVRHDPVGRPIRSGTVLVVASFWEVVADFSRQRLVRFVSCSGRVSTRDQLAGQLVLSLRADARALRIASFPCLKPFPVRHDVWLIGNLLPLFRSILSSICFFLECQSFSSQRQLAFDRLLVSEIFSYRSFSLSSFAYFRSCFLKTDFQSLCVMVSPLSLFRSIGSQTICWIILAS